MRNTRELLARLEPASARITGGKPPKAKRTPRRVATNAVRDFIASAGTKTAAERSAELREATQRLGGLSRVAGTRSTNTGRNLETLTAQDVVLAIGLISTRKEAGVSIAERKKSAFVFCFQNWPAFADANSLKMLTLASDELTTVLQTERSQEIRAFFGVSVHQRGQKLRAAIPRTVVAELTDACLCPSCRGYGKTVKSGEGIVECPDCLGSGHKPWADARRGREIGATRVEFKRYCDGPFRDLLDRLRTMERAGAMAHSRAMG